MVGVHAALLTRSVEDLADAIANILMGCSLWFILLG